MHLQRIILVDESRLMRELLKHVIEQFGDIEVVGEVNTLQDISSKLDETGAEWLLVAVPPGNDLSENLKAKLFLRHPDLRVISLWEDGSRAKLQYLGFGELNLIRPTLNEFETFLHEELLRHP